MGDGSGQFEVGHALAADAALSHLDTAFVADDAAETDTLVLAAVTLPVFGGAENALAEKAVFFRFLGPVVDGFRFQNFAVGPGKNFLGGGEFDLKSGKINNVFHIFLFSFF